VGGGVGHGDGDGDGDSASSRRGFALARLDRRLFGALNLWFSPGLVRVDEVGAGPPEEVREASLAVARAAAPHLVGESLPDAGPGRRRCFALGHGQMGLPGSQDGCPAAAAGPRLPAGRPRRFARGCCRAAARGAESAGHGLHLGAGRGARGFLIPPSSAWAERSALTPTLDEGYEDDVGDSR
ncbi:unnamed protein product, partial [Prorocentrum cordatum]